MTPRSNSRDFETVDLGGGYEVTVIPGTFVTSNECW
jgi:hypothetical protein